MKYTEDITRWFEHMKFIFEWKKDFTSERSERASETFFPREDKVHIAYLSVSANCKILNLLEIQINVNVIRIHLSIEFLSNVFCKRAS